MGVGREARAAMKALRRHTGMGRVEADNWSQRLGAVARRHGMTEGDALRIASETATMHGLDPTADHDTVRAILESGWSAGSLKTLTGLPMRQFAPLEAVLGVADAVCGEFWSARWAAYCSQSTE